MHRFYDSRFLLLPASLLLLVIMGPMPMTEAAKIKVWHHHAPVHYDKAQFKNAVVSSEGALRLSRQVKLLAGIDATHVWDVVEDREGNLFVATGDEGKLYKLARDGKVSVVFASEDSQILCLASGPDGSVYAGTGPGGQVVRIDSRGTTKVIFSGSESYIWSLAVDPKSQSIYAGTGPHGRIYKVTPEGKASVFYSTKQEHILCVALGTEGTLYAGTDKSGLVYRIDPRGKGFVLYQAPQSEIRALLVTPEAVYAGTSSPTRRRGNGSASTVGSTGISTTLGSGSTIPVSTTRINENTASEKAPAVSGSVSPSEAKDSGKSGSAAAPSAPSAGENSIYRIAADGTVREIFREKALVLSLLRQNGRLFVGTGMEGQLFELDEASKERSEIARLDHGQIHCIWHRHDGSIILGTGDPGKLYVLQDRYTTRGTVVSEVLDAKIISKWGALRWQAETPAGTNVTVAVRSGNLAEPDETWSDWSTEQSNPQQALIAAPPARFLQYRVTLASESPAVSPSLRGLTLRYMTTNQAPEVTALEMPDLDAANQDNPKKLKLKWTATDPNEDDLSYSLHIRKEGWKSWVQLEENLDKKEYEWDTTTTPSGIYQLKVVASDRKDNSDEDALTGERISSPFAVAHTPPTVTMKVLGMEGEQALIEATATDPLVRLASASFAVNGKKWVHVFPTDGLFDSKNETFRFKTEVLKPGMYVVVLRVRDAAGNTGSGDVVFNVQARTGQK